MSNIEYCFPLSVLVEAPDLGVVVAGLELGSYLEPWVQRIRRELEAQASWPSGKVIASEVVVEEAVHCLPRGAWPIAHHYSIDEGISDHWDPVVGYVGDFNAPVRCYFPVYKPSIDGQG